MKIKRTLNALPSRPSDEVWKLIRGLVTGRDSVDADHLASIAGSAESVITDEFPTDNPFVFFGVGNRLVIYCQYASNSMDDENIDSLTWNPTAGDWRLAVPSDAANLAWLKRAFAAKTSRVIVYDIAVGFEDPEEAQEAAAQGIEIDWKGGA
ncbi:MAG TPA: hypothetical protein VGH91_12555 [Gammaproteobacteria bacterium]|jgi:hypothetical protein